MASRTTYDNIEDITFRSKDLEGISPLHDDALVISMNMVNFKVKKILIDNGSIANILSYEVFTKVRISTIQLKEVKTPLQGFGGGVIIAKGVIELPLPLSSN